MKQKTIILFSAIVISAVLFIGCEAMYEGIIDGMDARQDISDMIDIIVPWVNKWFYRYIAFGWFCIKLVVVLFPPLVGIIACIAGVRDSIRDSIRDG